MHSSDGKSGQERPGRIWRLPDRRFTAMPGALPTIWCDMHGVPKNQQRGLVQPFIAAMQIFALVLMLSHSSLSSKLVVDFVVSLPALAAGTLLGIAMFRSVNELAFRRFILLILLFSGLSLVC